MQKENKNIGQFNRDVNSFGGYFYTTSNLKSCKIANARLTKVTLEGLDLNNNKIIDIGCGDGVYTNELCTEGKPKLLVGVDAASEAIILANKKYRIRGKQEFIHESCYNLPYSDKSFDIAIIRGLLHHLEKPKKAIEEAMRVASVIFIIEPNGYNFMLKIIERSSTYHRHHGEKSYLPGELVNWIINYNGHIINCSFAGLVPFICPDWMAILLKRLEPLVEKIPILNKLFCAVCIIKADSG